MTFYIREFIWMAISSFTKLKILTLNGLQTLVFFIQF
jgi:hypothetical protein